MYGIGKRIAAILREKGMTLTGVAAEASIARETLSGIVNDKRVPRKATIEAIAQVLGVSIDDITGFKADNPAASVCGIDETLMGAPRNGQGDNRLVQRDDSVLLEALGIISLAAERKLISDDDRAECQRIISKLTRKQHE